jgi:signal transduction histidine kinase
MMLRVRRTVRLRLTALYCGLFMASAVVLLAITNEIGASSASSVTPAPSPGSAGQTAHSINTSGVSYQYLTGSLIALGVMAVASIAVGWLAAGRVLRPLRVITAATQRISADRLHERLALTGPNDELKDLSDTIDELLARLDGAFAAQRRFVANASHELRTPLATLRALADVAAAKPGPVPAETITLASRVRTELDTIDDLLDGLLALARAQHAALPDQTTISLDHTVAQSVVAHAKLITARGLTLQQPPGGDGIPVLASPPLLSRMVDNLLDNAIVHNHEGGWIRLGTGADAATARLTVENGGDMLDQAAVDGLAQPFRRLGADRTGSDNGAGLGLSIVAAIAHAHGGTLRLHARADGGLTATIELPLASAASCDKPRTGAPTCES